MTKEELVDISKEDKIPLVEKENNEKDVLIFKNKVDIEKELFDEFNTENQIIFS